MPAGRASASEPNGDGVWGRSPHEARRLPRSARRSGRTNERGECLPGGRAPASRTAMGSGGAAPTKRGVCREAQGEVAEQMSTVVDPRSPCIIGVAQMVARPADGPAPEPLAMWEETCRAAAHDASARGDVLSAVESLQI